MNTPKLHVMLDTNAVDKDKEKENGHVCPLGLVKVIGDPLLKSLNIAWSMPEMVCYEREHHLRKAVRAAVNIGAAMPKLFAGTILGDESAVHDRIHESARSELKDLGIEVRPCDPSKVDWALVMSQAGFRQPPFGPDDSKEKGFKDAIVAETFFQLCSEIPANGLETAILVTNDGLLRSHVLDRAPLSTVKVLPTLDALRNELNFLVSDIDPSMQADLHTRAIELISNAGTPGFWQNVWTVAFDRFGPVMDRFPGYFGVEPVSAVYYAPVFLRKEHRLVYFVNSYEILRKGKQWVPPPPPPPTSVPNNGISLFGPQGSMSGPSPLGLITGAQASPPVPPPPAPVGPAITPESFAPVQGLFGLGNTGHFDDIDLPSAIFNVTWSASYDVVTEPEGSEPKIVLTDPRFVDIELVIP